MAIRLHVGLTEGQPLPDGEVPDVQAAADALGARHLGLVALVEPPLCSDFPDGLIVMA